MKVIGIIGSYGNIAVTTILEKYFYIVKKKIKTYNLNGMFVKRESDDNDDYNYTYDPSILEAYIRKDRNSGIDYVIVKIEPEIVIHKAFKHVLHFDLLVLTKIKREFSYNFHTYNAYVEAIKTIIGAHSNVLIDSENIIEFNDVYTKTYSTNIDANYKLNIIKSNLNGTKFEYNKLRMDTHLITDYHATNIICTIALLENLDDFNFRKYRMLIRKIKFPNDFESINYKGKTILFHRASIVFNLPLEEIIKTMDHYNFRIIINDFKVYDTDLQNQNSREIRKAKTLYLVSNQKNRLKTFIKNILKDRSFNIKMIDAEKEEFLKILKHSKKEEVLVIFTSSRIQYQRIKEAICG